MKQLLNKSKLIWGIILLSHVFADIKIGYIDSHKIMSEFEEVRQVQIELEKVQRKMEAELNNFIDDIDSLKTEFERQRLLMSEVRREEKRQEIILKEKQIQEFQLKKFGPEGEIYSKQSRLMAPVLDKVDKAIQIIGAERGYDYIFDANAGAIVYALNSQDLTEIILEELKKNVTPTDNKK